MDSTKRNRNTLYRCLFLIITLVSLFLVTTRILFPHPSTDTGFAPLQTPPRRHDPSSLHINTTSDPSLSQHAFQITPELETLLASKLPRFDSRGHWTGSPTLNAVVAPGGRDLHPHLFPYAGTAFHLGTTLHPSKDRSSQDYVLTTLWFFEAGDSYPKNHPQSSMTKHFWDMTFECVYEGGESVIGYPSRQIRDEYMLVHCPPPKWASKALKKKSPIRQRYNAFRRIRESAVTVNVYYPLNEKTLGAATSSMPDSAVLRVRPVEATTAREIRDEFDEFQPTHKPSVKEVRIASHSIHQWETPERHSQLSICTAPLRFDGEMTMTDVLEWRVYHLYQGVEVVHFYSRTPEFRQWVERSNVLLGVHDTVKDAPIYIPSAPFQLFYADQPQWQADCLLRWGFADEWQLHIDIDEYIFPSDQPHRHATLNRLEQLKPQQATVKFHQTYYGGERHEDIPSLPGFDVFPRNAFTHWTPNHFEAGARWPKAAQRTAGVVHLWVHDALSLGQGWTSVHDNVGNDTPGVLQLLHSRRKAYKNMKLTEPFDASVGWRRQWKDLAEQLQGLEELHTLVPLKVDVGAAV